MCFIVKYTNMPSENDLSKLALITVLKKCSPEVRSRMINYLNPDGIKVLSEAVFNVLFNDFPITKEQRRRLRKEYSKDKEVLKEIAKKNTSFKRKRQLLKQKGGFMGTLLGKVNMHFIKLDNIINIKSFFRFSWKSFSSINIWTQIISAKKKSLSTS